MLLQLILYISLITYTYIHIFTNHEQYLNSLINLFIHSDYFIIFYFIKFIIATFVLHLIIFLLNNLNLAI